MLVWSTSIRTPCAQQRQSSNVVTPSYTDNVRLHISYVLAIALFKVHPINRRAYNVTNARSSDANCHDVNCPRRGTLSSKYIRAGLGLQYIDNTSTVITPMLDISSFLSEQTFKLSTTLPSFLLTSTNVRQLNHFDRSCQVLASAESDKSWSTHIAFQRRLHTTFCFAYAMMKTKYIT